MVSASRIGSRFRLEMVAQAITAITGGLLVVLLARILEPSEYGLFYLALSFFSVAKVFSKLGIGPSASRYIAEYKETDPSQLPSIISYTFKIIVALSTVTAAVIIAFRAEFSQLIGTPELEPLLLFGTIFLITGTIAGYNRKVFQGLEEIRTSAKVQIVWDLSKFTFVILLALAGFGAVGAMVGYALGTTAGVVVGLAVLYRRYDDMDAAGTMASDLKRRIVEYSFPLTATTAAGKLNSEFDTILVGVFLNPVAVGYYAIAKQVITFIKKPASALGFTLAPSFASETTKGNTATAARMYEESLTNVLLLYIPAAVGIIFVAEPFIELFFGAGYMGAVPVLQVMSLYGVLVATNLIAGKALDYLGRARARAIAKTITSILNVGLNIILIPTIGVVGAAIATVVTYSIYALANLHIIHTELDVEVRGLLLTSGQIVLISLAMGATVFVVVDHVTTILELLLVIGLGGIVWAVLSVLTGLLDVRQVVDAVR